MKLTSVLSEGLLLVCVTSTCLGSTISGYDPNARTYTLFTSVTSQFNPPIAPNWITDSFQGTFTIQFFGLNGIYDPTKYYLVLSIPVIQTVTSTYPQLAQGMVCLNNGFCIGGFDYPSGNGTRMFTQQFYVQNLNTIPFSWTFSLTAAAIAESHQPIDRSSWVNTTATATETVDFGDLTLTDPFFGHNLLSQGVTFEVQPPAWTLLPEPSCWLLVGGGLALLALYAGIGSSVGWDG